MNKAKERLKELTIKIRSISAICDRTDKNLRKNWNKLESIQLDRDIIRLELLKREKQGILLGISETKKEGGLRASSHR